MTELTTEQKALQEKLSKMSPEELKTFQKQQCIFCQIIDGKVPSQKVYEDDLVFAVLDINPASKGHILLMPKDHVAIMPQIEDDVVKRIGIVSKYLSHAILKALKPDGTTIFAANGFAAGQRAQHFMLHIIPRVEGDNLPLSPLYKEVDENLITQIANNLRQKLGTKELSEKELQKKEEKKLVELKQEKQESFERSKKGEVDLDDIASLFQ